MALNLCQWITKQKPTNKKIKKMNNQAKKKQSEMDYEVIRLVKKSNS